MDRQTPSEDLLKELGDSFYDPGKVDVTNEEQVASALKKGIMRFQGVPLRGVVNCAGFSVRGEREAKETIHGSEP
jgi:hypothetical protein